MALLKSDMAALSKSASAPAFTLQNIDGTDVSLSDFEGKPVAIIFMCNHCPYVIPKFKEIGELQQEFYSKGIAVLSISSNNADEYPDDSFENMQAIAKKYGFRYYLYDETQDVAKAYGAVCTPDVFVFDKNHRLVFHGRINDAMDPDDIPNVHTLRLVLEGLVNGKEPADWFVPSQGCSIKWKN